MRTAQASLRPYWASSARRDPERVPPIDHHAGDAGPGGHLPLVFVGARLPASRALPQAATGTRAQARRAAARVAGRPSTDQRS